jgi:hypothetical protein
MSLPQPKAMDRDPVSDEQEDGEARLNIRLSADAKGRLMKLQH